MRTILTLLLVPLLGLTPSGVLAGERSSASAASAYGCEAQDCSLVLPGADRFEQKDGQRYWTGFAGDEVLGWVALSTDIVDIMGYSGKPLITLVGLDTEARIAGVALQHHSEPILLVGIPEDDLLDFIAHYEGLNATDKVSVGGSSSDKEAIGIDAISGATVTVLAEDRTIMDTASSLGIAAGVVKARERVPGHFVEKEELWSWKKMKRKGVFGRLTVSQEEVGKDAYRRTNGSEQDEPFIDLWFGIVDAPQVGRSLLGDDLYRWAMDHRGEKEHLLVVYGNGISTFRGSGFVRGGTFDRIRLEQGLATAVFTDKEYKRLRQPHSEGAPHFKEAALFRTPKSLDPGRPYTMVFLASRFSGEGGFDRSFSNFESRHRLPRSIYKLDGPDPENAVWKGAWRAKPVRPVLLGLFLLAVAGLFVARRWLTADILRLKRLHITVMLIAFFGVGVGLGVQPSVTQVLTLVESVLRGWRWGLFLSEPLLVVFWGFIAAILFLWGRGVFCGWACPYGAMTELLFKLGGRLGLPRVELPVWLHKPLRWTRYLVLALLVAVFLHDSSLGERLAEIEPFKSTFYVHFWTRPWPFWVYWSVLFLSSTLIWRPFCQYLCPLGAALALPSSFRRSGPRRRDFCSKCKICTRGCEPRAIREDGSIDSRDCLNCMECEANYRDDTVCPPLVNIRRKSERQQKESA